MEKPKMTREQAYAMIGKKTPLPAGRGAGGLNDLPINKNIDYKDNRMGNYADPLGLKKNMKDREKNAGLKSGGTVKKYKSGGTVRGMGCAVKGKKYMGMR